MVNVLILPNQITVVLGGTYVPLDRLARAIYQPPGGLSCKCPDKEELFDGNCVPMCTGDLKRNINTGNCECPSLPGGTATQCGDKCVDTNTDENNCGVCGKVCSAGG